MSVLPTNFLATLGTLPAIDVAIQRGRGAAASVIGQTYDVRRLSTTTNGSVSSNPALFLNYPVKLKRTTSAVDIENQIFQLLAFDGTCDNRGLELMDQLTETGYEAMPQGTYIVAQLRPGGAPTILMRAEQNIAISRPVPTSLASSQQPPNGASYTGTGAWSGVWKSGNQVLTLVNGLYAFSSAVGATPAGVACGLSPNNRLRDGNSLRVPTEQYRDQFFAYLPNLPGVLLNELDQFDLGEGNRYEIAKQFSSDLTGLAGQFFMLEKLGGS